MCVKLVINTNYNNPLCHLSINVIYTMGQRYEIKMQTLYMNSLVAGEKPAAMQHGGRNAAKSLIHTALPLCTCACVFLFWSTLIGVFADNHCVPTAVRTVR